MNRKNRTLIVLLVAVAVASGASYFVYRAVSNIPVREIEVKSYYVAIATKPLPVGTMLGAKRRQARRLAGEQSCRRRLHQGRRGGQSRPDRAGRRERTAHRHEARADRSRRRPGADDCHRHARHLRQGQRGHWRRRIRGAWHARRRGRHDRQAGRQHFTRDRQQRASADRRHEVRPGAGEGRQAGSRQRWSRCW